MLLLVLFCLFNLGLSQTGQWKRTQCSRFTDLITQWGNTIDPLKSPVLPEYPRPQLVRPMNSWHNLNGLWGFRPAQANQNPPFGQTLNQSILVPFPVESCLSGIGQNYQYLWYRTLFNLPTGWNSNVLLHFGAIDWQSTIYINGQNVGSHTGGYDPFYVNITKAVKATDNELIVYVYDPSDTGFQPNGKQRISAINNPDGDTYTPSSGIWQTVWLEQVPDVYIEKLVFSADTKSLTISTNVFGGSPVVNYKVMDGSNVVATGSGAAGSKVTINIPNPKLWSPSSPFLYDLSVSIPTDTVTSYFGMRTITLQRVQHPGAPATGPQQGVDRSGSDLPGYPVTLSSNDYNLCWAMCNRTSACEAWAYAVPNCDGYAQPTCWLKGSRPGTSAQKCRVSGAQAIAPSTVVRPYLNGEFLFFAGWLDQSFWPDGLYTAPTDDALAFDLQSLATFGLNTVRLHQKVNPQRWYYYADKLGVIVLQDMIQKYGGATSATIQPFRDDFTAMINGLYNHPSIVQWTVFNEGDCVGVFNVPQTVSFAMAQDLTRLYDTNSGGPANDLHLADVNDIHTYPYPGDPIPSITQYAMLGEFGGVGAFVAGHEWVPGKCQTYLEVNTPADEANTYIAMTKTILSNKNDISCSIYTQITDVERECDGFLNYDRTNKFTAAQTQAIKEANQNLIKG